MPALSDDRIRQLFEQFRTSVAPGYYGTWHRDYAAALERFAAMSDEELLAPASQEKLWRARGISGIGPGEAVNVEHAYSDPEIAALLLRVRNDDWGRSPEERAKRLQAHAGNVLSMVNARGSSRTPNAKLARAFTALRPADGTTCFGWKPCQVSAELVLGQRVGGLIETGVMVSHRLQSVLNTPPDAASLATRGQFVWWLVENRDAVLSGTEPQVTVDPEKLEPLALWPATRQFKGVAAVNGYHNTYRAVIRAAQGGADAEDIVATLETELQERSPKGRRAVFNRVRHLELLTFKDGLWYPSETGEELLESDPPDVLVELTLVRYFGPAHLLRFLKQQPRTRRELSDHLRGVYPNWTTNFAPSMALNWLIALGLIKANGDGTVALTPYGQHWESRLPPELPVPESDGPALEAGEVDDDEARLRELRPVPIAALWEEFQSSNTQLVFSEEQIRSLHSAWHFHPRKRFVILSGLSGTGKTQLLLQYARAYCGLSRCSEPSNIQMVAVSPDWRDPTGLLGYFNALHADPTFHPEPALQLLLHAARRPSEPFFLILDEMNLARVERYFAPFLSAMETGGDLVIHAQDDTINGVPPRLPWPNNLFIGGTVNMDETTYAFSDKVLDRAFTLEFWDVDLKALFERRHLAGLTLQQEAEALLLSVFAALQPIRRHFGYRTAGEFLDFVAHATDGSNDFERNRAMLDRAVFSKLLPRLRGEESDAMKAALQRLAELMRSSGLNASLRKIEAMQQRLSWSGATQFWS